MTKLMGVAVLVVSMVAAAQPLRNKAERARDRQDLRQDRRQLANDSKDLADVSALLTQFDGAVARNDAAAIAAIDGQFGGYLDREAREAQAEAVQANKEVREDKREVRSDRRELGQDVALNRRPGVVSDDTRDFARDRVNLADDRSDAARERNARNRLFAIRAEVTPLKGLADAASVARKRALYAEVVTLAKGDLARTKTEQREDRRELREDRRETREDRRDPIR